MSAKQPYAAHQGQCGHIFQAARGSLVCIHLLLSKIKILTLHLDCRAGALCSSPCNPLAPSSATHRSAPQVLPSCSLLPWGNQDEENSAHLGYFLTWGQHVARSYLTSQGTDITRSECALHCKCGPVALGDFRLLLMQLCYLKMNAQPVSARLALPSFQLSQSWKTLLSLAHFCSRN